MNHIKVTLLLLFLITRSFGQDDGSKNRFDKILEQFGFSGIGSGQRNDAPVVTEPRQQSRARDTPRTAASQRAGSGQRNRDSDIQSNNIPNIKQGQKPGRNSDPLAALFSVAGKPKEVIRAQENVAKSNQRPRKKPDPQVLNERIENPSFKSGSPTRKPINNRGAIPSRKKPLGSQAIPQETSNVQTPQPRRPVNNRGIISKERNNRNRASGTRKGSQRNNENNKKVKQDVTKRPSSRGNADTLDIRQQLPNKPIPKFTSRGISIVSSVQTNSKTFTGLNPNRGSINTVKTQQLNSIPKKTQKPAFDPVANLLRISNSKSSTVVPRKDLQTQQAPRNRGRGQRPTVQQSKGPKNVSILGKTQKVSEKGSKSKKLPVQARNLPPTQDSSVKPAFNFDETLKEFGFSPRLISGTSFKSENAPPVKTKIEASSSTSQKSKPFTVFTGDIAKPIKSTSNSPSFTSRGIPIISSKPVQNQKTGLSSLIALAGDPKQNPVSKISNSFVAANKPTTNRPLPIRKGPTQVPRKSPTSRLSPTNSVLGNLESIAAGNGPTFTVKNRARGPSRNSGRIDETRKTLQAKSPTLSSKLSSKSKETLFEINPFVNVNLQKQQSETVRSQNANIKKPSETIRSQNANIRKTSNNLKTSEVRPQSVSTNDDLDKRVSIPRQSPPRNTSNRPKIFIDNEEFEESVEEESNDRERASQRKEQRNNKEERKERPKKKRPKKQKKIEKKEQRPPVIGGCFHVCETLIFEVYKLLGGSLCDC